MKEDVRIKLLGNLISGKSLNQELMLRKRDYVLQDIPLDPEAKLELEREGWVLQRELKTAYRMKGPKPSDVLFEDKVWTIFGLLGFTSLNKDRNFCLPYDKTNHKQTKQIDIFARDEESVIYIECKSSKKRGRGDFKKELESWKGIKRGIENSIRQLFPGNKPKTKFILATENQTIGPLDQERLKSIGGYHLDEEAIDYYLKMYAQIGLAARYQLLGSIFEGSEIPDLDNQIPAIRGKMGSLEYYSFSIEPSKLLKIGYVLHRSKANKKMMPTYQRIIKRARLKAVREFLDEGGFFPNSIIINLVSTRKLRFDDAPTKVSSAISKVGILHLPKRYRSAYIIDGQHRLYGYSDSVFSHSNSIPVVAFINLKREQQVELFMQINENQKAVPKTLRETLNSDLLWTSDNKKEQLRALCSRISIYLSEEKDSPLFDYISIGEDNRVLTPGNITSALKKSNMLGIVTKTSIQQLGTFYKGDLETAFSRLYEFLRQTFLYLQENLEEEWRLGKDSFLFVNKGVYAVIRLLSDIIDHLEFLEDVSTTRDSSTDLASATKPYLDTLIRFVIHLDQETKARFADMKGSTAPDRYWRRFQVVVKDSYPDFSPEGLDDYIKNENRALNVKTFEMIKDIEEYLRVDFKTKLVDRWGEDWAWKKGVPEKVQDDAEDRMRKKNRTRNKDDETQEWDNLNLIHYRSIAEKNWGYLDKDNGNTKVKFFELHYTKPGEEALRKEEKTKWWVKINELRNIVSHVSSDQISEEDFDFVLQVHNWLIKKETKNKWQLSKEREEQ